MTLTRRRFLSGLGGTSLVFVFDLSCAPEKAPEPTLLALDGDDEAALIDAAIEAKVDYRGWLAIARDGAVTAHTGRMELGQGLKTVLSNVICQALELPGERVHLVMGDTDLCPDDGPTTGSNATRGVGWRYWVACHAARNHLLDEAARRLRSAREELVYEAGEIYDPSRPGRRLGIGELGPGVRELSAGDLETTAGDLPPYVDRGTPSVEAEAIVTGTKSYAGDLRAGDCLYGGFLLPEYHAQRTELLEIDLAPAENVPGLVKLERIGGTVAAIGRTYTSVQKALAAARPIWKQPPYPPEFDNEQEIRKRSKLVGVLRERGDVERALAASDHVISESYVTQYATPAPIETHTALADVTARSATAWVGTQSPFLARERVARALALPDERVRIVGMPPGGGFGEKAGHNVADRAAVLSSLAGEPVKYVQSRKEHFQAACKYKHSVVIDITTGVSADGEIRARTIDFHQGRGKGTRKLYDIPAVRYRSYRAQIGIGNAIMRGTSYTQTIFALESHTDMVARAVGIDPVELRRRNVLNPPFLPLLDRCAEMLGYPSSERSPGHGQGFGICYHGVHQYGVVGAVVEVDRKSGTIGVVRLCGAFDIGQVMNRNTASMGVRGAMIWGLGYALLEEARFDAHRSHTAAFEDYRVPRFSDVPEIELAFLDNHRPGVPRGCGEVPVPPTIAAICNAVYDATGVRFYTLPMTPARVRAALES